MALVVKDRVRETTATTGTGTLTLGGAVSGFQDFSVIGNGNTTYYAIVDAATGSWEVGLGTYTSSGTTLSRDTVLESSNNGNLVPFLSGTKDVFCTYPAERSVVVDGTTLDTFGMGATQGDILYASATDNFARLAKSATATRYLANTGSNNNPAWDQVNLADGVTGDLPFANLTQGSALSVLGVTGNATADVASIAAGTDNQVLRRSGTALAFGAVNLASTDAVTGTLPLTNGGSGQTSAQTAMNAFAGAVTSGQYLRGNGTNVVMSAIQAADVPTLNQNTTGSAATLTTARTIQTNLASTSSASFNGSANITPGVTGTLGVASGGTGQTTYTNGQLLIGNTTGNTLTKATLTAGTNVSITNGAGSITIDSTAPTIQTTTLNSGTSWSKPTTGGYQWVQIELWGGGGSGGKGSTTYSGGGGGGGAYTSLIVPLSYLAASENYSIGGGGNAQTTASTAGNAGGTTSFNITNHPIGAYVLYAYGGGGGASNNSSTGHGGGGGGGGGYSVGGTGSLADGGAGGDLTGGVAQASSTTLPGTSTYGGGGGSRGFAALNTVAGGAAYFGGGGGGGGGAAGGASAYGGGGGGGGGTTTGAGAGGTSTFGGAGGAGAVSTNSGTAGTAPSGGGGGIRNGTSSGAGAAGRIRLTWW